MTSLKKPFFGLSKKPKPLVPQQRSRSTNFAISKARPNLLEIQKTNSATLSSFSYDGETAVDTELDLISLFDGEGTTAGTLATDLSSRPPSANSNPIIDSHSSTNNNNNNTTGTCLLWDDFRKRPTPVRQNKSSLVVQVGPANNTVSYSITRQAFDRLALLQWQRNALGHLHLPTCSPAVFEVLLNHVLFETLPAYDTLSQSEYEEFEPLALALQLNKLVDHFDRTCSSTSSSSSSSLSIKNNKTSLRSSSLSFVGKSNNNSKSRRRSSAMMFPLQKNAQPKAIVLNHDNVSATSIRVMAAQSKCARFVASLKQRKDRPIRNKSKSKYLSHEELVQHSEHIF